MATTPHPPRQPYPRDHASHLPILIGLGMKIHIRRVLELGAGSFSTPLFLNRDVYPDVTELISVETDPEWLNKVRADCPDTRIQLTPEEPVDHSRFDLIFVDSPHAALRIEVLKRLAAIPNLTALVIVHDSENPFYRAEFTRYSYTWDVNAYDPATSILWMDNSKNASLRVVFDQITGIINQFADCPPDDVAAWIPRFRNQNVRRLTTSVAMVTYRRTPQMRNTFDTYLQQERRPDQIVVVEDGFEDGTCALACEQYRDRGLPIEYYLRKNRPDVAFSNAAIPRNIAIRRCTGDIILLHNSEVRFTQPTDFANIVAPVEEDSMVSSCAPCMSLNEDGTDRWWYCDPSLNNFNHFCQAYRRDRIVDIGAFDEAYRGYGYEDGSFNWRMERSGVRNRWARNVITQHQWHFIAADPNNSANEAFNLDYGKQEVNDILTGRRSLVANVGREWGDINS